MANDICADLIMGTDGKLNDFEVPMITELFGNKWKGKADIVNHNKISTYIILHYFISH